MMSNAEIPNRPKKSFHSSKPNADEMAEEISELLDEEDQELNPALESIFVKKDLVDRLHSLPIWLISIGFHIALMVFMAMHYLGEKNSDQVEIVSQPTEEIGVDMEDLGEEELDIADFTVEEFQEQPIPTEQPTPVDYQVTEVPLTDSFDFTQTETTQLIQPVKATSVNGLSGRLQGKATMLKKGGGNAESEKAVEMALEWIASKQQEDGGWSLQIEPNPGTLTAPLAATSMALLPFLGAGNTTTQGKYAKVVERGIDYLLQNGVRTPEGFDLRDAGGRMYTQGLASIVLCEAYAMADKSKNSEKTKVLATAAQEAIRFIEYAQDPSEGGWRYTPHEPGDTSVMGWQLMALKSASYGGLHVNPAVQKKALNFLINRVSYDNQSRYGYLEPNGGTCGTTAIGLLCRLFLGWKVDTPSLRQGLQYIMSEGPDLDSPYQIYYATQLVHHMGGPEWKDWNSAVRDNLIQMQNKEGNTAGSWTPSAKYTGNSEGGRLYATTFFCMTLEVYYRHMPIYQLEQEESEEDFFPLD